MSKKALYLAGGGARGAYQAGALMAIKEILAVKKLPFDIISGVSVGCLNAGILVEHARDFSTGIKKLEELWSNIYSQQIFHASNYELSKSVLRNLSHILTKQNQAGYLLDTLPLHDFIGKNINFDKLNNSIKEKDIEAMEVISHCFENTQTLSFYQHSSASFQGWHYPRHSSQSVNMNIEHLLASSALPLFFPPVKIEGLHYGDGSMGLAAPLRGALRFQADKVIVVGTRKLMTSNGHGKADGSDIGLAQILGSMLSGLFLDNLDRDIEMVNRMNEIAKLVSLWKKRRCPWRPITTLYLRPSINIAAIAVAHYNSMPALLRFLLNVLGAKNHSGDLLSFLLFEKSFSLELIKLGFADTMASREAIIDFFSD